jgi:catechol 2,3-dioxygenase-like lactoylglutathione lyase family enzyme
VLKNLMYVTVYVSDQSRSLTFYAEQLGLEKRIDAQGLEGRFLTVAPMSASVEIVLWPKSAGPGPALDLDPGVIVPGPLFIESDDLAKDFEVLRSRGVIFVEAEPTPYPFGLRMAALDPDGNRVELRQPNWPSSRRALQGGPPGLS